MNRFVTLAAAGLLTLGLAACGPKDGPAEAARDTASPDSAIKAASEALRSNDLHQFLRLSLPEARYQQLREAYEKRERTAPDGEEAAEFAAMMAKLTAPEAEKTLMAELEPALIQFETEMAPQMPMMIGMGRGFAAQAIQQNTDMSDDQKLQATQVIDAMGNWLSGVQLADRDLASSAISKAVASARTLDIKDMQQLEALDFDQMMEKAGVAFGGVKEVLGVYGLDIDAVLASTRTELVSQEGDNARLKVSYTLFGQTISAEQDMVREQDRWYSKEGMTALAEAFETRIGGE
ncbi:MAG: hypothetical protein MEQ07_11220 [Aquimonas sp.]|nr:hypothetical protein [Aquimonas sp.]